MLIIGGGLTGILCAYYLKKAGIRALLIEAERIGCGVSGNTTAKITVQHGLIYDRLIRRFGTEGAQAYFEANRKALARYRELCQEHEADFEERELYVYSRDNAARIERELRALERIGAIGRAIDGLPLPIGVAGAIRIPEQAQCNPYKLIGSLASFLDIREGTRAIGYEDGAVVTEHGRIFAKRIIVATHFPIFNKHGLYFMKMYQHRSYVLALEGAPLPMAMYVDEDINGLSFRSYGSRLLLGGGGHKTGKSGGGWSILSAFSRKHYRGAVETFRFATQDCMTLDGVPYIGEYSARTRGLYVATGFNKWGMTGAMVAATLLTERLAGKREDHAWIFSPSRSMLTPQLVFNAFSAIGNLLRPTVPRCPHLGCALRWNAAEHTWDCPCHGSRFSQDGELLDAPATGDIPAPDR